MMEALKYKYKGRELVVERENIFNLISDALMIPANPMLSPDAGLAKQLIELGGAIIYEEAKEAARDFQKTAGRMLKLKQMEGDSALKLPPGTAHITSAGQLKNFKKVIHVITTGKYPDPMKSDPDVIRESVENGLRKAADNNMVSVSMPLMGAGFGKVGAQESMTAIGRGIVKHFSQKKAVGRVQLAVLGQQNVEMARDVLDIELGAIFR